MAKVKLWEKPPTCKQWNKKISTYFSSACLIGLWKYSRHWLHLCSSLQISSLGTGSINSSVVEHLPVSVVLISIMAKLEKSVKKIKIETLKTECLVIFYQKAFKHGISIEFSFLRLHSY